MRRGLLLICLILACVATMALAGDTPVSTPAAVAATPKPLSVEMRYANVQRAMAENSIGFRVGLALGDDGRVIARVEPFDTAAK